MKNKIKMETKRYILEIGKRIREAYREGVKSPIIYEPSSNCDFSSYRRVCAETRAHIDSLKEEERVKVLRKLASRTGELGLLGYGDYNFWKSPRVITRSYLNLESSPGGFVISSSNGYEGDRENRFCQTYFCLKQLFPLATEFFQSDFFKKDGVNSAERTYGDKHAVPIEFIDPLGIQLWGHHSDIRERLIEGKLVNAIQNFRTGKNGYDPITILFSVDYDRYFNVKGLNELVCGSKK
jgi:hypothetical protein